MEFLEFLPMSRALKFMWERSMEMSGSRACPTSRKGTLMFCSGMWNLQNDSTRVSSCEVNSNDTWKNKKLYKWIQIGVLTELKFCKNQQACNRVRAITWNFFPHLTLPLGVRHLKADGFLASSSSSHIHSKLYGWLVGLTIAKVLKHREQLQFYVGNSEIQFTKYRMKSTTYLVFLTPMPMQLNSMTRVLGSRVDPGGAPFGPFISGFLLAPLM